MKQFLKNNYGYVIGTVTGLTIAKFIYIFILKDIIPTIQITINFL